MTSKARPSARRLLTPPGTRETTAEAGGRWRVLRGTHEGAGVPALLVHGGGSDHAGISWYHAIGDLARDRPVYAPDLPGCGGSTDVAAAGSAAAIADRLVGLLDALRVEKVVAIGVSLGGDVVMNLALRHPDRVAALVPVAAGGLIGRFGGPLMHRVTWLATRLPDGVVMPASDFSSRWSEALFARSVTDVDSLPPEVVAEYVRESRAPGAGYAYWRYNKASVGPAGMRNDLTGRLGGLEVPTLFLHSPQDPLVPVEGSRRAAAEMPDARLVEVPGVGHWLPLEAPAVFAREVGEFAAARGLSTC